MASIKLFVNRLQDFNAATVAGSGVVIRWTYTVPSGKRAIVRHCFIEIVDSANAANTTFADIFANSGASSTTLLKIWNDTTNQIKPNRDISYAPNVELTEGDTVQGRSFNNGANNVTMIIRAVIEEYG